MTSQVVQAAEILYSGVSVSEGASEFLDTLRKVWLSEAEVICLELDKTLDLLDAEEACGQ